MSFFAGAGGRCFRGGVTSYSSSLLRLWRRTISSHSCCMSENPSHFHNQQNLNNPNNPKPKPKPKPKQAPWLLLSSPANPQHRYLYNLTFDDEEELKLELDREIELPRRSSLELEEHIFIGSSEGFLISINIAPSPTIHLFNPIDTTTPPLPPDITTLPPPPKLPPPSFTYLPLTQISKTWKTPPVDFVNVDSSFFDLYKTKAILSPSLDTIVLLPYRPALMVYPHLYSNPVFAPLHSSSSSSLWTEICPGNDLTLYEGIFHKGLLHGLGSDTGFYILDLKSNRFVATLPDPILGERNLRSSLVESPDGDDLFLVYRDIAMPLDDPPDDYDPNTFEVFKLIYTYQNRRKTKKKPWEEVKDIGDLAFFIGSRSSSLSIDVSDRHLFPSLKPNSIYFADSWEFDHQNLDPDYFTKAGACTMEDEKTHYIELRDGNQRQLNWPPPLWYMPTPAL